MKVWVTPSELYTKCYGINGHLVLVNPKEFGYHGCNLNPVGHMETCMIRIQIQAEIKTHQIENFIWVVSKTFKFLGKIPQKNSTKSNDGPCKKPL